RCASGRIETAHPSFLPTCRPAARISQRGDSYERDTTRSSSDAAQSLRGFCRDPARGRSAGRRADPGAVELVARPGSVVAGADSRPSQQDRASGLAALRDGAGEPARAESAQRRPLSLQPGRPVVSAHPPPQSADESPRSRDLRAECRPRRAHGHAADFSRAARQAASVRGGSERIRSGARESPLARLASGAAEPGSLPGRHGRTRAVPLAPGAGAPRPPELSGLKESACRSVESFPEHRKHTARTEGKTMREGRGAALLGSAAIIVGMALAGRAGAQPAVVDAYRRQLSLHWVADLEGNPTQMAWGPEGRLYVRTTGKGVHSYAYDRATGQVSDHKVAVPHDGIGGIGIAFHGARMYLTEFDGSIHRLDDRNGNGVWGETAQGELNVAIVTGIP